MFGSREIIHPRHSCCLLFSCAHDSLKHQGEDATSPNGEGTTLAKSSDIRSILKGLTEARPIPAKLAGLVQSFRVDENSQKYDETTLRVQFLNPLLEALGWDPLNRGGTPYSEREVIHEDKLAIDGHQKAPDYAFITDRRRRFFLEAKRPSVNIEISRAPAYQLRRYCWTAGLPYGLVTDFEEFAIYDCRRPPASTDSPAVGRVAYFTLDQFEEYWPLLEGMFGRVNVAQGILELLASEAPAPAGTRPIDTAFLSEIQSWREMLATDIAIANPVLSSIDVSSTVQTLIDRIIFLRIAEARGLESEDALGYVGSTKSGIYKQLLILFRRADDRYNSGLFCLNGGADDPHVDRIAPDLIVSDDVLRTIIGRLYFPEPYEFSVMPADILGRIYEQFLSEHIVVDADRSVRIELKPEHRKSGGVYYTPGPIVDYIVEETLGPLLNGKNPAQLRNEGFAVVDPASGSGSFLISAYQYLLDWHRDHWALGAINAKKYLETGLDGQVRVKTSERKRILLEYIFGVDIDRQAVEVTKLSLLLKVIDGQSQLEFDFGRILPDLDKNILCGNSLIDRDFQLPFGLSEEEESAFNPFSWAENFPQVFKRGGFDAVIGNPPYLNVDATWGRKDPRLAYLKSTYPEIHTDKTDLLFYFLRKAASISRGESAFIVSRSFLEADKAQKLRGWLASNIRVRHILDFRHARVFPKVGINTAIIRLTHSTAAKNATFARFSRPALRAGYSPAHLRDPENLASVNVPFAALSSGAWNFGDPDIEKVLAKLDAAGTRVGEILHVGQGPQTGANKSFQFVTSAERSKELRAKGLLFERARNSDIHPYFIAHSGVQMLYVEDVKAFDKLPVDVQDHLQHEQVALKKRAAYLRGDCDWWRYSWPLHRTYFGRPRILSPYRASSNRFALDDAKTFLGITDTTILYENDQPEDIRYILGLLNTRLLTARFRFIGKLLGAGVLEYYENTVSRLPIPRTTTGQADHDRIVELVRMIEAATVDHNTSLVRTEQDAAMREISSATSEIEEIAARLYGVTPDEQALLFAHLEATN